MMMTEGGVKRNIYSTASDEYHLCKWDGSALFSFLLLLLLLYREINTVIKDHLKKNPTISLSYLEFFHIGPLKRRNKNLKKKKIPLFFLNQPPLLIYIRPDISHIFNSLNIYVYQMYIKKHMAISNNSSKGYIYIYIQF